MPFQVTDADQRNAQGIRSRFGITEADQKGACQTGSLCDGNGAQISPSETGFVERPASYLVYVLDMSSRCEFRHHPAKPFVDGLLRRNDVGEDLSVPIKDGGGSFITGGFDAEDGTEDCCRSSTIHTAEKRRLSRMMCRSIVRDEGDEPH